MKGLLKNNYFAVRSNAKAFSVFMLLLGIFVVAVISPSLLMGYALLGMIGFSLNAIAGLRKESSTKWSKYKLTAPVKRSDIVKSYFISQILWLIVGIAYAGIGVALSIMLHGVTLDRNVDIFMLFVIGIGISLFMGAIFFPLFYLGGEERNEVFLIISLLCGIQDYPMRTSCKAKAIPFPTRSVFLKPTQSRTVFPICAGTRTMAILVRTSKDRVFNPCLRTLKPGKWLPLS